MRLGAAVVTRNKSRARHVSPKEQGQAFGLSCFELFELRDTKLGNPHVFAFYMTSHILVDTAQTVAGLSPSPG